MWTLLFACSSGPPPGVGSGASGSPQDPLAVSSAQEATQIGDEGTEGCEEGLELIAGSEEELVAQDMLARLLVGSYRAEPAWFDGRTEAVTIEVAHEGAPVWLDRDCGLRTELSVSVVSDAGAVDVSTLVPDARLSESTISLGERVAGLGGALALGDVRPAGCSNDLGWDVSLFYSDGLQEGIIQHICDEPAPAVTSSVVTCDTATPPTGVSPLRIDVAVW